MSQTERGNPFKIPTNLFDFKGRLALSQAFYKPVDGICVTLLGIAGSTCRKDIVGSITSSRRHRDKMLLHQNARVIPKTRRITAVGTTAMPVFKRFRPMFLSETEWQLSLSGSSPLFFLSMFFWIEILPTFFLRPDSIRMSLSVSEYFCFILFQMRQSIEAFSLMYCRRIKLASKFLSFIYLFAMRLVIQSRIRALFSSIGCVVFALYFILTRFTGRIKAIFCILSRVEILSCSEEPQFAFRALFMGNGFVNHDVSLSSHLILWSSANGEINRWFGLQSLADDVLLYHKFSVVTVREGLDGRG